MRLTNKTQSVYRRFYSIYTIMLSYYHLNCGKNTDSKNLKAVRKKIEEQCFYQNVQCVIVKYSGLLKSKKLVDY